MVKLDVDNITEYLKSLGLFNRVDWKSMKVEEVTEYTNVNYVFAADLNSPQYRRIYLKQAFDHVKIRPDFPAPIERQKYEKLSIDYLQRFWQGRIPEVIHYDERNDVLILTDIV